MYFYENETCLREYQAGKWQVDHETGLCTMPLTCLYTDIANKFGLKFSAFDAALFTFAKWGAMPWNEWHRAESVTEDLEPAGDYSDDFESVTEGKTCVVCGQAMETKRSHAVTCSPKCRKALSRRNNAA